MHQNNFLFVTGFSSKPEILQRNHSFLNNPQQIGSHDSQNQKNKIDFVQRNKCNLKVQKSPNLDNTSIQKQGFSSKNQHSIPKRIQISKRLNQSVGLDDDSQELNSEITKLSQSFDFKMMKAKRILRRIVPKDQQYPGRSYSSIDKFVEESNENQTKFRTKYQKYEQDKENHNINLSPEQIKGGDSKEIYFQSNERLNSNEIKSSNSLRQMNQTNQQHQNIGIKCATQPDLEGNSSRNDNIYVLDLLKEQETILKQKQKNNTYSANDIVKDSYFNQDSKKEEEDKRHLQYLIQEAKKKCPDIKHLINQSIGGPSIDTQDISIKTNNGKKVIKITKKSNNIEENLIEAYNRQSMALNNQQRTQIRAQDQSKSYQNQYQMDQRQNFDSDQHSTITFNQKSTIDETLPNQNLHQSMIQNNSAKNISYETLIKNEEDRIKASKQKERIVNNHNISIEINYQNQNQQQMQQQPQQRQQSSSQLSTQYNSQIDHSIQGSQLENQLIQIQDQNSLKPQQQHRVIQRNYDYQIGIKNNNINNNSTSNQTNNQSGIVNHPSQMSEKLMIQHQIYSSSPNNPVLSTQNATLTDKSTKSNTSNSKGLGQLRQNLVLFYNNKKKEVNLTNSTNNTSQLSSQFQMETVQESGFQPQYNHGKSPFKQGNRQIIISHPQSKKFNFQQNTTQTQQNIMNTYLDVNTRTNTEPIQSSNQFNSYTPLSLQKKTNQQNSQTNSRSQQSTGHFNNFLEEFNLDSISIGANQPMTKSSSKSRRTANQLNYQLEVNSKTGTTPLSLQNKSNAAIKNAMRYQSSSQQGQYYNNNQNNNSQQAYNYIKSASSLGFNESDQNYHHNIISNPPLLSLSQDNCSDGTITSKHTPFSMYGNSMPVINSTQSRKSGGTGGQNMVFEFHEVRQQPQNYRSLSQQSNRNIDMNFNLSIDRSSAQGIPPRSQSNHCNINQFQNFQLTSLNMAPPSCSSAQSLHSSKFQNKLNQSIGGGSSKNLIDSKQSNVMREMYTELDEDIRIFDFSPKRMQSLKQNQLQKSIIMSSSNLLDFNNTSISGSMMSKTNGIPVNQPNEFKQYNETAKNCINKLENSNKPSENNAIICQYLDSVRSRITQLKNKKKNTEIDLILHNSKIIQDIESSNTHLKVKMPHHLNQQLDELYQQIKKNIFIYSCQ